MVAIGMYSIVCSFIYIWYVSCKLMDVGVLFMEHYSNGNSTFSALVLILITRTDTNVEFIVESI